jgi:hypothetical protein
MDIFETLIVTFVVGGAPAALWMMLRFLLGLIINTSIISDKMQISALDRHLAKNGWCSSRMFDFSGMPSEGVHALFMWSKNVPSGIMIACKWYDQNAEHSKKLKYTIYWMGRGAADMRRAIIGNPNAIKIRNVYMPSPWRTSIDISYTMPPEKLKPWQCSVVDQIVTAYATRSRVSYLVCGPPGCGKSTLGEIVASRLKGIGVTPEVVKNGDLTTANLLLEDLYDMPTPGTPIILMLDEFDGTVKYAERDTSKDQSGAREAICLANTPTLLLSTLDQLARTSNLIVIATSNLELNVLRTGMYQRYTRVGRMDKYYQVTART